MKLTMELEQNRYDIFIKDRILHQLHNYINVNRKILLISDTGVPKQYIETVQSQCPQIYIEVVEQGEQSKTIPQWQQLLQKMVQYEFGRGDAVVALGGGMVGDLAGFVAASYMRGIDFINLPTTTLAQIDSSIGGKTALNLDHTKNVIGAFWQPKLVLIDPQTLQTLSYRQYTAGLVEAIKAGLLADEVLFQIFLQPDYQQKIQEILYRSLLVKKQIVQQDERENGIRAALNLGHTIGHGIEAATNLSSNNMLYHGECVALGILPMIEDPDLKKQVQQIFKQLKLPENPKYDLQVALQAIRHDKKAQSEKITVVKVERLAKYRLEKMDLAQIEQLFLKQAQNPIC